MMMIVTLEQGTRDWRAFRAAHRMASESPALLGLSPWFPRTPLQLWEVKSGLAHVPDNPAMARGRELEAAARALYEVERVDLMVPHLVEGEGGYAASLDGLSLDGTRILEVKCPYKGTASYLWAEAMAGRVPEHYQAQVQHQLIASEAECCDFAVYAADASRLAIVEVRHDLEMQARIHAAWEVFWPYFASGTPPEPTELDYVAREDEPWGEAVRAYRAAEAAAKQADADLESARKALVRLTEDRSCQGHGLIVTRYWQRGSVDYARVPELRGVDLEGYRKPGGFRFRINGK